MLVHEPKRVHQLMHELGQPFVEALRVQADYLGAPFHPPLAFALCSRVYDHVVGTWDFLAVCWFELHAGNIFSDVIHGFHQLYPQRFFKSEIPLILHNS